MQQAEPYRKSLFNGILLGGVVFVLALILWQPLVIVLAGRAASGMPLGHPPPSKPCVACGETAYLRVLLEPQRFFYECFNSGCLHREPL